MTKRQLSLTLEPFDDDIEIILFVGEHNKYEPKVFYTIGNDCNAQILLTDGFSQPLKKSVELKVRG